MLIYVARVERRQFLGLISVKKLIKNHEAFTRPSFCESTRFHRYPEHAPMCIIRPAAAIAYRYRTDQFVNFQLVLRYRLSHDNYLILL